MKTAISIAAAALFSVPVFAGEPGPGQSVQIRLTYDHPVSGAERMQVEHAVSGDDSLKQMLFVDRRVLVDQSGIKSAEVALDGEGQPRLDLQLTEEGLRKLGRRAEGHEVAIVVNGQAMGAGRVQASAAPGKMALTGEFSEDEARVIAGKISPTAK